MALAQYVFDWKTEFGFVVHLPLDCSALVPQTESNSNYYQFVFEYDRSYYSESHCLKQLVLSAECRWPLSHHWIQPSNLLHLASRFGPLQIANLRDYYLDWCLS